MVGPQGRGVARPVRGTRGGPLFVFVALPVIASHHAIIGRRAAPSLPSLSVFVHHTRRLPRRRRPKIEIRSPLIHYLSVSDALHNAMGILAVSARLCTSTVILVTFSLGRALGPDEPIRHTFRRREGRPRPSGKKPFLPAGGVSYILNQFSPSSSPSPPPRDGPRFN